MTRAKIQSALILATLICLSVLQAAGQATSIPAARQISPEELVKVLQASSGQKPLVLHVGPHMLYAQAHIPGSEYVGAASTEAGLQQLRKRVDSLPRTKFIVFYCGCCPWGHAPT